MRYPILLSALSLLLPSCAYMVNGSKQFVGITTTPPGASLFVDGKPQPFKSPASVELSRTKRGHIVRMEAPGYTPAEVFLTPRESSITHLNLLLGGVPGYIIDFSTGGIWYYDHINFNLAPLSSKLKK